MSSTESPRHWGVGGQRCFPQIGVQLEAIVVSDIRALVEPESRSGMVLDTSHAAVYCGLSRGTMYNLQSKRQGPPAFKHGRKTVYYPADLDAWLATRITPCAVKHSDETEGASE